MRGKRGFGLMDLLIAFSLAAVLFFVSLHGWQKIRAHWQKRDAYDRLANALMNAKEMAMAMQSPVVICAIDHADDCGEDWSEGVLVKTFAPGAHEKIILRTARLAKPQQLIWRGGIHTHIEFWPDGSPHSCYGSFWWKEEGQEIVFLTINHAGHVS